jgi:hypothetical protein
MAVDDIDMMPPSAMAASSGKSSSQAMQGGEHDRQHDLRAAEAEYRHAHRHQARQAEFEADGKHQEHHAEFGQITRFFDVGNPAQREGTDCDAGDQIAEHRRQAQGARSSSHQHGHRKQNQDKLEAAVHSGKQGWKGRL